MFEGERSGGGAASARWLTAIVAFGCATADDGSAQSHLASAFESARVLPLPLGEREIVPADLDGDGDLDLVAMSGDRTIRVLRNRGDGNYDAPTSQPAVIYAHHLACADFDGDGDVDLFTLDEDATAARIYANAGDGTLAPSIGFAAGYHPIAACVADFDGDGRPDVALQTSVSFGGPNELRVLWNDGAGALATSSTIETPSDVWKLRAGDVDLDGRIDLVVYGASTLRVVRNRGDGTFENGPSIGAAPDVSQLELGDLDRDGDLDAVLVRSPIGSVGAIHVARNTGGAYAAPEFVAPMLAFSTVELADCDGDRRVDLVLHDRIAAELRWLPGRGDATFGAPRVHALTGAFEDYVVTDVDGDGDVDFAAGSSSGILLVENRGAGRFDAEERNAVEDAYATHLADFDGDGDLDAVRHEGVGVHVHENLGNGTYGPAMVLPESGRVDEMCVADVDGDGYPDIATIWEFASLLIVWTSNGDMTFSQPDSTRFGGNPGAFAAGDVDGDGDVDFVITLAANFWADVPYEAIVLENAGDGTFARGSDFATDRVMNRCDLVDFDGDGDLDLVLADDAWDTPHVVRNDGTGNFDGQHPTYLPWNSDPRLDVDGDGHVDLIGYAPPDQLTWSRNRGDGTFEPPRTIATGQDASGVVFALDLDGDGDLDLTSGYALLENDGNENFELVARLHGAGPFGLAAGDVDGDGDEDFVLGVDLRVVRNGARVGVASALGDGSGVPCPCGNFGAIGRGCANSVNANGAELRASGNARIAHDTLVLHATGTTSSALLWLQGTQSANDGLGAPFGDGLIGVAGTIRRLATTATSAGSASFPVGNARPVHVLGGVMSASTRTYQALYRDAASHCTPFTFNLTNALVVTWMP